jgi:hypothetical protein
MKQLYSPLQKIAYEGTLRVPKSTLTRLGLSNDARYQSGVCPRCKQWTAELDLRTGLCRESDCTAERIKAVQKGEKIHTTKGERIFLVRSCSK